MSKRPTLKDQLAAQRTTNAPGQSSSVADTFRKDDGEVRVRTSMYLPESLAKQLKHRAVEEGVRANEIVVWALAAHLNNPEKGS